MMGSRNSTASLPAPAPGESAGPSECEWTAADFQGWYEASATALRAFVATRVGPSQADDMCQLVWTHVWRKRALFRGGNYRAWLFQLTRNLLISRSRSAEQKLDRRSQSLQSPDEDAVLVERELPAPSSLAEADREVLDRLRGCLQKLDEQKRSLVEGWMQKAGYAQFAAELGLSEQQAHRRFHTAKENLRRCLERNS